MALPLILLAAIMGVITAPGLIAQHLAERRAKRSDVQTLEGQINA